MCLGRTELPLGAVGRMQAALLGAELSGEVEAVYSSPLSRAVQTAQALRRRSREGVRVGCGARHGRPACARRRVPA